MLKIKKTKATIALLLLSIGISFGQMSPDYKGGFKIKFDQKSDKYLRFISFLQVQAKYNNDVPSDVSKTSFQLRRARLIAFSQINKDFLVLFHLGLNSFNNKGLSPVGKGESSQLFLHDAYLQYKVFGEHLYLGGGLHYYNGISRLNNQSSTNMVTLSNNRSSWATVGLADQFARQLGVFIKGSLDRVNYRFSINEATISTLDKAELVANSIRYQGNKVLGSRDAGKTFSGYFDYNFLDQEKSLLPYMAGTYLGAKKVFNIGAGFFAHPNGVVSKNAANSNIGHDVNIFSVDAYYDAPLYNGAISAYAQYQNNDYGSNYNFGPYASGNMVYGHVGYLIPSKNNKFRVQPFVAHSYRTADALQNTEYNSTKIGANVFLSGHNSKLSIEYQKDNNFANTTTNLVTLQAQILF
ncbi:hypothetical protein LNJ08_11160 [Tenacibaculum finnmarkense genomovar ulcerans]|uniref:hypothetical protein n=1 Tax=Tenacibaculum finnmarkense TaxID=2781243 RepID=UPI001E522509|nr:hypothetical protein [Tenacibaculum finnmarkense]MCD8454947.1 hypothetical protein [Tenacibaculum finnmarkense genomovar ulcerans]